MATAQLTWLFCPSCYIYQHFYYFYYVQSALPPPFHIFLFLLSLHLAFPFISNLPQTTTAKGMEAGSSLGRSADLWCCCYSYLHFFSIIVLSPYLHQVRGSQACLSDLVCFFFSSLPSPLPLTHLCPIKHLQAFLVSSSCAQVLIRSLCPAEMNGRPSKEIVRNRAQNQLFSLQGLHL